MLSRARSAARCRIFVRFQAQVDAGKRGPKSLPAVRILLRRSSHKNPDSCQGFAIIDLSGACWATNAARAVLSRVGASFCRRLAWLGPCSAPVLVPEPRGILCVVTS